MGVLVERRWRSGLVTRHAPDELRNACHQASRDPTGGWLQPELAGERSLFQSRCEILRGW